MKYFQVTFWLLQLVLLSACGPAVIQHKMAESIDWPQQQAVLAGIQQWHISGRIAVQTAENGGQADFYWQQNGIHDYRIKIQAPLGVGTTWIEGNRQGVVLRTSAGEEAVDQDVDRLIYQLQGWPLPVSGLYYWVRGLPADNSQYSITQWHDNGLPNVIEQDGWRIELRSYVEQEGKLLPKKLFISRLDNQEVDVRLIVRRWEL